MGNIIDYVLKLSEETGNLFDQKLWFPEVIEDSIGTLKFFGSKNSMCWSRSEKRRDSA